MSANSDTSFFGHPRGLSTLFFTEMWERFSYYGMRGLLMLFMTTAAIEGGMGFETGQAGIVYGLYTSLVYLATVPGGWLADRFVGARNSVLYGGIIIALGHFTMAFPSEMTFYLGLFFVVLGTGLLKPNISVMVGEMYDKEDIRRDAGFSVFYMGINLGAFIAPLILGYVAQHSSMKAFFANLGFSSGVSWHVAFGLAGVGMLLGLVQYMKGGKYLGDAGKTATQLADPIAYKQGSQKGMGIYVGMMVGLLVAVFGLATLVLNMGWAENMKAATGTAYEWIVLFGTGVFFGWLLTRPYWESNERKRLVVILILFLGAAFFWAVFEQAGSVLNLFATEKTELVAFGFEIPSSWFQSINGLLLVIFAPVFAGIWLSLAKRKQEPGSPAKFAIGLFFIALSAVVMYFAVIAAQVGKVSPMWLIMTYLLQTLGELCLSPVGLSSMTRLAPQRVVSLMMGTWFLATSIGNYFAGKAAVYAESLEPTTFYMAIALAGFVSSVLMFGLVKPINNMLAKED